MPVVEKPTRSKIASPMPIKECRYNDEEMLGMCFLRKQFGRFLQVRPGGHFLQAAIQLVVGCGTKSDRCSKVGDSALQIGNPGFRFGRSFRTTEVKHTAIV